jgi:putative transposase
MFTPKEDAYGTEGDKSDSSTNITRKNHREWRHKAARVSNTARTEGQDKPSVADKVDVAERWISKGFKTSLVLGFVGLSRSTYHAVIDRKDDVKEAANEHSVSGKAAAGRPVPGYSYTFDGRRIPDETIKSWICTLIEGDGFPYGYRKLTVCLKEDYFLRINHKKVYRLCAELGVLRPQRRIKRATRGA